MIVVEIFFTCWIIFLSDGSVHCYCENELPPVVIEESIERAVLPAEARDYAAS